MKTLVTIGDRQLITDLVKSEQISKEKINEICSIMGVVPGKDTVMNITNSEGTFSFYIENT